MDEYPWPESMRHYYVQSDGWVKFTADFRLYIHEKFNGECWYCGINIDEYLNIRIDHQIPRCQGGGHEESNLVLTCANCNSKKGKRTVEEYRESLRIKSLDLPVSFSKKQLEWLRTQGFEIELPCPKRFHGEHQE